MARCLPRRQRNWSELRESVNIRTRRQARRRKEKGKEGLTHYFTQHLRSVIVSDQINREFGGVVERPLEWMAWLRSGLGIAFEVDPCDLDEITGLVGFEVDHAWDCESAWLGGLGVEVDDVAVWIEEGEAALISLVV